MAIKIGRIIRVVVICVVSVVVVVFLYLLINNFQFSPGISVNIKFDHIGGLNIGSWVKKAGVKIGSVTDISVNQEDQRTVIITITLNPGVQVREQDRFIIMSGGIIGDQYIEVLPGPLEIPAVPQGYVFQGDPMKNLDSLLLTSESVIEDFKRTLSVTADIFEKNQDSIDNTIKNIEQVSSSLKAISKSTEDFVETVPHIIEVILASISSLESTIASISEKTNKIMDSLEMNLSSTLKEMEGVTEQISTIIEELSEDKTVLGILKDEKISADFEDTLVNLNEITENIVTITEDIKSLMADIVGPEQEAGN